MSAEQHKVEQYFLSLQTEMIASLAKGDVIPHPSGRGDSNELNWWNMLATYLPSRYAVFDKAFIVDYTGAESDEVDLVLCDRQYSPLVFAAANRKFIPAEAVYAVFEVKPETDRSSLLYAAEKAASVRVLKRTTSPIVHAGGTIGEPREPGPVLAGLLSTRWGWAEESTAFDDAARDQPLDGQLNLGCALKYAGWQVTYEEDKSQASEMSEQAHALVFFFIRLQARLRELGTAPAIDWTTWGSFLRTR
jgi:hypothetical protein